MVIIGLVGFSIDRCMYLIQRRVLRWKQGYEG
jgi:sulfonate transport system permease protein